MILGIMDNISSIGRMMVLFGLALTAIGAVLMFAGRVPWVGRLPGDIYIQKKNFSLFFPVMTFILVSIILSLLINLFRHK